MKPQSPQLSKKLKATLQRLWKGFLNCQRRRRFGVYTAYKYYTKLLAKLKQTPSLNIQSARIRVPNYQKMGPYLHVVM